MPEFLARLLGGIIRRHNIKTGIAVAIPILFSKCSLGFVLFAVKDLLFFQDMGQNCGTATPNILRHTNLRTFYLGDTTLTT